MLEDREERLDSLMTEAHIVGSIWNLQIAHYGGFSEAIWIELTQEEFAEYIGIGKRTLERLCSRLAKMNRINRVRGKGKAAYAYQVSPEMLTFMITDVMLRAGVFLINHPNGMVQIVTATDLVKTFPVENS